MLSPMRLSAPHLFGVLLLLFGAEKYFLTKHKDMIHPGSIHPIQLETEQTAAGYLKVLDTPGFQFLLSK
jgi:hypothetical protein